MHIATRTQPGPTGAQFGLSLLPHILPGTPFSVSISLLCLLHLFLFPALVTDQARHAGYVSTMDDQSAIEALSLVPPSPFVCPLLAFFAQLSNCLFALPLPFISCVSSSLPRVRKFSHISFSPPHSSPQPVHKQSCTLPPNHVPDAF